MKVILKQLCKIYSIKQIKEYTRSISHDVYRDADDKFILPKSTSHEVVLSANNAFNYDITWADPNSGTKLITVIAYTENHGIPRLPNGKIIKHEKRWYYLLQWRDCSEVQFDRSSTYIRRSRAREDNDFACQYVDGGSRITVFLKRASLKHAKYIAEKTKKSKVSLSSFSDTLTTNVRDYGDRQWV